MSLRSSHDRSIPLVDRDDMVNRLRDVISRPTAGGVLLVAPAGGGKTRLVEELLHVADELGRHGVFVRGRSTMEGLPLGPFAALLPPTDTDLDGVSLLVTARRELERRAGGAPLLLAVDDIQLLDPLSATLVHQLVVDASAALVGTLDEGTRPPGPVAQLERTGLVERWAIGPLSPDGVLRVAEALLGSPVPPDVGDDLIRLSGGNPLFVTTLVRSLEGAGGDGARVNTASATLADFVAARLQFLDPDERDALAAVALAEPIGVQVLSRMVEPALLDRLERAGWISIVTSKRRTEVQVSHSLFGEVMRQNVSRLLARSVHRALVAEVLDRYGARRRDDLIRLARWSLDCGVSIGSERLAAAMHEAIALDDLDLATRIAERLWDDEPTFAAGWNLLAANGSRYTNDRDGFAAQLRELATSPVDLAELARARASGPLWFHGDVSMALDRIDDELERLPPGEGFDLLVSERAVILAVAGRPDEARRSLDRIGDDSPATVRLRRTTTECHLAITFGDPRPVLGTLDEPLFDEPLHDGRPRTWNALERIAARARGVRALVQNAEVRRAEAVARELLELAAGNRRFAGNMERGVALTLLHAGRPAEAARWAERAVAIQRGMGIRAVLRPTAGLLAAARALMGDVDGARAALAEVDSTPDIGMDPGDVWLGRATAFAAAGDVDRAIDILEEAIETSSEPERPFDLAHAWYRLARLDAGRMSEAVGPLERIGRQIEGLPLLFATEIRARLDDDADQLVDVGEQLAAGGLLELARQCLADATLVQRAGRATRDAARSARRAAELTRELDRIGADADDPPLIEPLSPRELEIARLAADGRPTRRIADELFLSARTVDNHLARVYEKLGIHGRSELDEALAGLEPAVD